MPRRGSITKVSSNSAALNTVADRRASGTDTRSSAVASGPATEEHSIRQLIGSCSGQCTPYTSERAETPESSDGGCEASGSRGGDNCFNFSTNSGCLEALLAEQRLATERALQLNEMITMRLTVERLSNLQEVTNLSIASEGGASLQPIQFSALENIDSKPPPKCLEQAKLSAEISEVNPDLTEPLLPDIDDLMALSMNKSVEFERLSSGDEKRSFCSKVSVADRSDTAGISMHMFPMVEGVKTLILDSLSHAEVKEEAVYKQNGFWSALVQNPCFSNITLVVIVMNTLWIAVDTDYNSSELLSEADWQFQLMDNLFCTFFTFEMLSRFLAFKHKAYALTDPWFLFDGFLVALMIWETWVSLLLYKLGHTTQGGLGAGSVLRIFRIFRLLRVARTARLLNSVPELLILTKGMLIAMRSVMVILGLLAFVIYIFAVLFTQLLAKSKVNALVGTHFQTVPTAANFLMLQVFCGFDADVADALRQHSTSCYVLFILYLLIGSLTILNMLIGILCDVVFTVADDHKEETFQREMEFKVSSLAESLDVNNRGVVAAADFEQVIQKPEVVLSLVELGVDVTGLVEFGMFVFQDSEDLSYENFLHMVLQFRTGKPATVKDVMDLRKQVSGQLSHLLQAYETTSKCILQLQHSLYHMDRMKAAIDIDESSQDVKFEVEEAAIDMDDSSKGKTEENEHGVADGSTRHISDDLARDETIASV